MGLLLSPPGDWLVQRINCLGGHIWKWEKEGWREAYGETASSSPGATTRRGWGEGFRQEPGAHTAASAAQPCPPLALPQLLLPGLPSEVTVPTWTHPFSPQPSEGSPIMALLPHELHQPCSLLCSATLLSLHVCSLPFTLMSSFMRIPSPSQKGRAPSLMRL